MVNQNTYNDIAQGEQMLWYDELYENTTFTNKWDPALLGKENAFEARGGIGKE